MDQNHPWPPAFFDQGTSARRLERFKRKVQALPCSTFSTPDNLASRVASDVGREMVSAEVETKDALIRNYSELFRLEIHRLAGPSEDVSTQEVRAAFASLSSGKAESLAVSRQVGRWRIGDVDHARFVARKEWFGSLVYDRERGDYIPFDQDATDIFVMSTQKSKEEISRLLEGRLERKNFDTFVGLCQSIELLDANGRFTGEFVKDASVEGVLSAPIRVYFSCTCPWRITESGQNHAFFRF